MFGFGYVHLFKRNIKQDDFTESKSVGNQKLMCCFSLFCLLYGNTIYRMY